MSVVKVGQIWKENDARFMRYIKVLGVPDPGFSKVIVQTCEVDGSAPTNGQRTPKTRADISRFGRSGATGYTLVRDSASNVLRQEKP